MPIKESLFRTILTTKGRKTGKSHSVMLRAVNYNNKIYFSRHRPDSDWFLNIIKESNVEIQHKGTTYSGKAQLVNNEEIEEQISQLKYPGEERANEKRVAVEITLDE